MAMTTHTLWRGMDRATLDREYNARNSVADFDAELARFVALSADARAALPMRPDLVYDPESGMALDWFAGRPGGPALLWIHGGYWRALSKAEQSLVAPGLVAAGAHVAVMDYSLAPAASLDRIVHQVRTALAWVAAHAATYGADPARIYAAGHSAGGQLVGMLLAPGWHDRYGVQPDVLRGGVTLSGLFELEPVRLSHINDWLGLDPEAVGRLSPQRLLPPPPAPRLLASVGGRESGEFRRQTADYAAAYAAAGHDALVVPQPDRHHFDIVAAFGDAADPLCRAVRAFMQLE